MLSTSAAAIRGQALAPQQRRAGAAARPARGAALQTQALFSFLAPPKAKAANNRAKELVDELLAASERTQGGLNVSPARRAEIAELVEELEGFCPRQPLRSPLLFGDYEVVYASKPTAAGGPYRTLPGRIVFPGQTPFQSIREPNQVVNQVQYKALGFIPGAVTQTGEFTPISADTFELVFDTDARAKTPIVRTIQIAYLDDRVRVARSIPAEGQDSEGALFVFKRLGVEEEEEEVYEEEEEEAAPKPSPFSFGTRRIKAAAQAAAEEEEEEAPARRRGLGTQMLGGRREGLATQAEKRYAQQQGSRGTGSRGVGSRATGGTGTSTVRKTREEIAAERAAAREAAEEERRAAREAAAAAKAAAEEERRAAREQQEAERARQAELREQAKAQLAELQGEAAEAVDEAKEAAGAVKEAEKAASALLQQASQARGLIDQAASAAAEALQQLEGLKGAEKEAAAAVGAARSALAQLGKSKRR